MAIPHIKSIAIVLTAVATYTRISPRVVFSNSFKLLGLRILILVPIRTPAIVALGIWLNKGAATRIINKSTNE